MEMRIKKIIIEKEKNVLNNIHFTTIYIFSSQRYKNPK